MKMLKKLKLISMQCMDIVLNGFLLEENGYTGTVTVSGVIRAFQLENGLDPVGSVGPATLKKFKTLPVIEKMNPDDSSIPNVCLLQCALFLKGMLQEE